MVKIPPSTYTPPPEEALEKELEEEVTELPLTVPPLIPKVPMSVTYTPPP
jgi:hypothetical protein